MKKIKVVTLCSGYDAQCLALDRLKRNYIDFDYELVAWAEVDKYAIQAHNALFQQWKDRNMGDITSCDWSKIKDNIDLLTYSTPCQSISSAGKQEGLKKGSGTASSIIWSVLNAIDVLRPKYLLMENVKALVSSKFIGDFHEWSSELSKRGYSNFAKVLNSKCYNIPQNRERVFMVSILDCDRSYHFPEPFPLDKRLKDVLEQDVDERYYLRTKLSSCYKGNNMNCVKEPSAPAMRGREVYASKHVNNLVESGKITADEVAFLDGYNQSVHTDVSATIKTNIDKGNLMFVSTPKCLTPKRTEYGKEVRKEYESGALKESRHNMRRLEPREDGVCNTITSVQKDNLVVEPKILSYTRDANGKVVGRHSKDVANTIHCGTGCGGNTDSFVIEPFISEPSKMIGVSVHPFSHKMEFKGAESIKSDVSPTLRATDYKCPPAVWEMAGMMLKRSEQSRGEELGVRVQENGNIRVYKNDGSGVSESYVTNADNVARTNMASRPGLVYGTDYRIRKLTTREVFRLMDVDDADIDKIQAAGISRSQQYKMAGNSICIGVLYHIFRKLFIDTGNDNRQLTLF